jgi:hypothetical protein
MCLAEAFRDAPPALYAREVAERLSHSTVAVQQHIRACEGHLSPLLALLPYAEAGDADVGVQIVRNAGVLLKLQALSAKSSTVPRQQPAAAVARGGGGGWGGGGG